MRVHPNRALVTSGEGQRLVMAGGGSSWNDLALFLITRFFGVDEAMRVARLHLLETSDLPIEAVASEVGYEDASFFSRLFRRKVGLTAAQYRRRFTALRTVLGEASLRTTSHRR